MTYNQKILLYTILAVITVYGIITGRYLFLVFMFPIGFGLFKKKDSDKDD
ncbi:hypothetical protein [Winogradskyella aurantia]|jgi:hypothetical protein|nr:hypothetical protein [Winogradskyella aurantia]